MTKRQELKRSEEVERMVARLFARKGYHSTSMREIARELGMSQSSLYHYFRSKEDILFKLMNDAIDEALTTLEKICAEDLPPEEKLKRVLHFYSLYYAGDQERLHLLVNEINALGDGCRPILIEKQKRYVRLISSILEDLAERERIKEVNPKAAAFAFFGMVHYTVKWYRKDGPIGLDELASTFVEIFTKGLMRNPGE